MANTITFVLDSSEPHVTDHTTDLYSFTQPYTESAIVLDGSDNSIEYTVSDEFIQLTSNTVYDTSNITITFDDIKDD